MQGYSDVARPLSYKTKTKTTFFFKTKTKTGQAKTKTTFQDQDCFFKDHQTINPTPLA